MQLAKMLAGMAQELDSGQATPERQAEICRVVGEAAGAVLHWSVERLRRVSVVRAVALAVDFEASDLAAVETVRVAAAWAFVKAPADDVVRAALEAWRRDGAPRTDSRAATAWLALTNLVREAGLGSVTEQTLRVDWEKFKSMLADRV